MKFCKAELLKLQKLCISEFHNSIGILFFFFFNWRKLDYAQYRKFCVKLDSPLGFGNVLKLVRSSLLYIRIFLQYEAYADFL